MSIKLLVIGGVGGGATAAARARRIDEQAEIILFERGEYISFANCGLPYYIGQVIKDRDDLLVTTAQALRDRYNIDVRIFSEIIEIDREHKRVTVRNLETGEVYTKSYDRLILSPGAEPIKPPIDGIDLDTIFSLRNIPDSDRIKAYLDHKMPESVVVVGGGFIGLEMTENLVERGVRTTILERLDQVMLPLDYEMAAVVHAHLREKGIVLELENSAKSFSKNGKRTVISTEKGHDIECDLVILSIGVSPEKKLAKEAGLEIGEHGGISVDSAMRTSSPDIFAIGDAVEIRNFVTGKSIRMALAGPANKQGRIAADNALGRKSIFKGVQGTDVRDKNELDEYGTIEGALHIPINKLRQDLSQLDKRNRYVLFCAAGLRAYIAHRILVQKGFKSSNLNGGFITYLGSAKERISPNTPATK